MQITPIGEGNKPIEASRNDALKLFAMITMLIDHIGHMIFPQYRFLRSIGRLAFPIFAYQLAIGYEKTSSLKDYAKRLFIFGLISQVPYSFFSPDLAFKPLHLNIMFTLLLGLGVVRLYDSGVSKIKEYRENKDVKHLLYGLTILVSVCILIFAPEALSIRYENFSMDYGFYGLVLVLIFHLYRDKKLKMVVSYIMLTFAYTYLLGAKILSANSLRWVGRPLDIWESLARFSFVWQNITKYNNGLLTLEGYFFQARSIFALIPIYGSVHFSDKVKLNKYVGYWFYPVHIGILVIIAYIIIY